MMAVLDKESAVYSSRIDEIYEQFKKGKTFYAKNWVDRLTAPASEGGQPPIYIWGAGQLGNIFYDRFFRRVGIAVSAYVDIDPEKWGKKLWNSVPVIAPKEMETCGRVVIAVNGHWENIKRTCLELGVSEENIFFAPVSMMTWNANYQCAVDDAFCRRMVYEAKELIPCFGTDCRSKEILVEIISRRLLDASQPASQDGTQYFIPELPLRPEEAFVDAGAFDGDTLREFIQRFPAGTPMKGVHYYAFECGKGNYQVFQKNLERLDCDFPVELYTVALWDQREYLSFCDNSTSGSVNETGEQQVLADSLDHVLAGKKISWIKMDIEGAEMKALSGCAAVIQAQKPRLAICVYHKPEDFYEIPQYIKSLRSDYQFLLRHHSDVEFETVIYAY